MATHAELEKLAGKLPDGWALSVWLMRGCGLRIGEALAVQRQDVRGGQYRDVPLPAYVAAMIPEGHGDVFPPARTDVYRDRFRRAAKAAALPDGYHAHDLRHSFASALLAAGVPLFEVSRYLGHASVDFTAEVYGHLVPEAASRAVSVLDAEWAA